MKIGLLKEGKVPPDKRAPFSPNQCASILKLYPSISLYIQPSINRCFSDLEYKKNGVLLTEDLSMCDIIMGVKEVPINMLIDDKIFFFFSHTIKKQPYNKLLLQTILKKNIQLVDYETLITENNQRIIGFGRYAGIVGCYNTFLAYGKKTKTYDLNFPQLLKDKNELEKELLKISLPQDFKIILTGSGRVSHGVIEILDMLDIKKVDKLDFLDQQYNYPVYVQLDSLDYVERMDNQVGSKNDFYAHPSYYRSILYKYTDCADMLITGHYYARGNPILLHKSDIASSTFKVKVVGDISCDINGPVGCTIRPSTIEKPIYGYNRLTQLEDNYHNNDAIVVMAVDNLPCALPRDASIHFGEVFINKVLPDLISDQNIISRGTITCNGELTSRFKYLADYIK